MQVGTVSDFSFFSILLFSIMVPRVDGSEPARPVCGDGTAIKTTGE